MSREIDDGMQHGGLVGLSRDEQEIERLSAENKKLRANARRYEWLRSNSDPGPDVVRCVMLDQQTEPVETRLCFGDDLDAKIDAEMAAATAK